MSAISTRPPLAPAGRAAQPARYQRLPGLASLRLQPGPGGGVALPDRPRAALTTQQLAELVAAVPGSTVRILLDNGAAWLPLFSGMAGLLGRDVLVTPPGTRLQPAADGLLPVDISGRAVDWLVVQPPQLATALPAWFDLRAGRIRPRTGIVTVPLPDGVGLANEDSYIARRAAAAQLTAGHPGLATVAVSVRRGHFLIGRYDGSDELRGGRALAAALGDLPLYGADLRTWLRWPVAEDERRRLADELRALAEAIGCTLWTPPVGGSARIMPDRGDLAAYDTAGQAHRWVPYRPGHGFGPDLFETDPSGALVPVEPASRPVPAPLLVSAPAAAEPPVSLSRPDSFQAHGASHEPPAAAPVPAATMAALLAPTMRRPALYVDPAPRSPHGVAWLPERPAANADPIELYVTSPLPAEQAVAQGVPAPDLYLLARLFPQPVQTAPAGAHLLRVGVQRGGAVDLSHVDLRVPADLQHLTGLTGVYLLPGGWLDRVTMRGSAELRPDGGTGDEHPIPDAPLLLHCADARHGVAGLPNQVDRWPRRRDGRAYALMPDAADALPGGWLLLHRRRPPLRPGHKLLRLRIPARRAIDVHATAARIAPLRQVRSRLDELTAAGARLMLPCRYYDRVTVDRVLRPGHRVWRRERPHTPLPAPLTAVVQSPGLP